MKFILVVLIIAQLHGAFSASVSLQEQRGFLEFWDLISPVAIPIAHGIDTAIGTISNIHSSISNAVSSAIYGVTSWIGDKIPPLGKRDLENDARLNLLNELTTFKASFQQSIVEILQSFLSGSFAAQLQHSISKLVTFLNIHLQKISTIITNLIPTMEGTLATQAMTSSLHVIEVIQEVIRKIHAFFSS
ncbi:unnamed protein product [Rotaria magnacalcarata]|uniref:Uncharacterized protein n=1 Tax=Rotaria magnacalcarata TaxID=392030 RepID=A0A816G2M2_9BILA|nr:unnamed protein product [Rotaria magnacalcarata]CAF1668552.1 unnamed protein product [Rotaria magnacalcarata]CAF2029904.1 unnamed protein product [Rotaria magnacalcarata]CAF2104726.1 unnamed protein product [Rotaria magnacalcarata]CAF2239241.1 unnamed protein product [Rotaria magnacalcarata]